MAAMVSSWTALALRVLSLTSKSAHNAPVSFSCALDDKMTERNRLTLLLICILFCGGTLAWLVLHRLLLRVCHELLVYYAFDRVLTCDVSCSPAATATVTSGDSM